MRELVSVVIPTFQRPTLLGRSLKSVVRQTYSPVEVIVVDDSPSAYQRENRATVRGVVGCGDQVRYTQNRQSSGACGARNTGLNLAQGQYICFLDDDDEWRRGKLVKQVNEMSSGRADIVYTWADRIRSGRIVERYRGEYEGCKRTEILLENFIPSPTPLLRTSVVRSVGGWDNNMVSCQDWDLWVRLIWNGSLCSVVKNVEAYSYLHGSSNIGTARESNVGYYQFFRKHARKYKEEGLMLFALRTIANRLTDDMRKCRWDVLRFASSAITGFGAGALRGGCKGEGNDCRG